MGLGEVLLLAVLAVLVYYQIFSWYAVYDDEGYMMLTVKHFLANHTLYDEVWTIYGPVYFFHKWVIHGLFGLPLTHDVVRLTAMAIWLSTGVLAAIAAHALTGSLALAAVVQLLVTVHLATIVHEPGHPQELSGLLTMFIVAVPAIVRGARRRTLIAVGLMVAALTMIKVNLGMFTALGVWMALLSLLQPTAARVALRAVSSAALVALPALLMRPVMGMPWGPYFVTTEALSIVAISAVALTHRRGPLGLSDLVAFASSCVGGVVLISLATIATGTTLAALFDCLIGAPSRMSAVYVFMSRVYVFMSAAYFPRVMVATGAVALAVGARATQRWRARAHVLGLAKLAFGIAALIAAWRDDLSLLLGGLTPFLWLGVQPGDRNEHAEPELPRLLLCWVAVLEPLQVYPVAGSQLSFGTVLHVLVGAVCLGDGVRWLCSRWSPVLGRPGLRAAVTGIALLVVASLSVWQLRLAQQRYAGLVPLDLPGATRLRLAPAAVQTLRTLTHTLRERSDTFLCVPGFSSLYFWTGEEPPTLDVISHAIEVYSEERREAMLRALLEHPHPIVVHFPGRVPPFPPFEERLNEGFKFLIQVGPYQLLVPRGVQPDRSLTNQIEDIADTRSRFSGRRK